MAFELEIHGGGDNGSMCCDSSTPAFWPVQHPTEPLQEDRPILCPIPYSSLLKGNGVQEEGRFSADVPRRRSEAPPRKSGGILEVTMEPPVRAVRKRHHPLGQGYRAPGAVAGPVWRAPPQNPTMSQVLHQFNHHFKS